MAHKIVGERPEPQEVRAKIVGERPAPEKVDAKIVRDEEPGRIWLPADPD